MCGQPTALADAPLKPNARLICRTCVESIGAMIDPFADPDLDDAQAPDPTSEAVYEQALRGERTMHTDPHGVIWPGPRDLQRP